MIFLNFNKIKKNKCILHKIEIIRRYFKKIFDIKYFHYFIQPQLQ